MTLEPFLDQQTLNEVYDLLSLWRAERRWWKRASIGHVILVKLSVRMRLRETMA